MVRARTNNKTKERIMSLIQDRLVSILHRSWWLLLLRGLAAIAFGLLVWFRPGISLALLLLMFGVYTLVDGVLGIWAALAGRRDHEHWWVLLLVGLLGVVVGVLTFVAPGVTAMALLFYIALWAIGTGTLQIIAAVRLRKEIEGEWMLILAGLAAAVFGVVLIARPAIGVLTLLWLIASFSVLYGALLVVLAFRVRRFGAAVASR
jgi:uncharacterized membrane protein HdeD (DUF308 family)